MPTVTQIVDYVCDVTGWNAGASSTERALILGFVNQAYREALEASGNYIHTYETASTETISAGDYHYQFDTDFGFTSSDFPQQILSLAVTGGGVTNLVLEQVSLPMIRQMRDANDDVTGVPQYYCLADNRNLILYPTPAEAYTMRLDYVRVPAALTEVAGSDTEIMENIPVAMHLPLLGGRALAMCFETDGVEEKAQYWQAKADVSLEQYVGSENQKGGVVQPVQTSFLLKRLRRRGSDRSTDWG